MISPFLIDPNFFSELDDKTAKRLFADNVELVYMETHSKCNRTCWFCPNAFIDRQSDMVQMENTVFDMILQQLHEVDYSGDLGFCLYNGPLADFSLAYTRIFPARVLLPNTPPCNSCTALYETMILNTPFGAPYDRPRYRKQKLDC